MKVAIEGCAHGELDNIYESIKALESEENIKVDLLICCGDFQSVRNENDLRCMAIPPKYYDMGTFYKYYSGEKEVPVLTIFIGGNHEASNYLQELPYGGWVAPNIYYLGYGGVVNVGGLRIGGLSGIYKPKDYMKGHYEMTPYSDDSKRSVYHIRNVEVFRLKQLSGSVDVFLSHDWPQNITNHGNVEQLLRYKPFFKDDIQSGKLGSPPAAEILQIIKPKYWFSAHLHCKFAALVEHDDGNMTKFLALDKCLPSNRFLQIWDFPSESDKDVKVSYDLEWLTILFLTNHLFSVKSTTQYMPTKMSGERYNFTPTESEMEETLAKFKNELVIPNNFNITAESYAPSSPSRMKVYQPPPKINNQTTEFCTKLGIIDPSEILIQLNGSLDLSQLSQVSEPSINMSQTFIEDSEVSKEMDCSTSPVKRMSLVLPKPVNEEQDCDEEAADAAVNLSRDSNYLVNNEASQSNENPKIKKLKRRNADIYENQDD